MKRKKKYSEFLDNKRVVLVGPSGHLKGSNRGKLIDAYDVVVKMNVGYVVPDKLINDYGRRLDVYYCSVSTYFFRNNRLFNCFDRNKNIIWMIGTGLHRGNLAKVRDIKGSEGTQFLNVDQKIYKKAASDLRKGPSTGIIVIMDLLQYNIKKLYITGITFFDQKYLKRRKKYYYSQYCNRSVGNYPIMVHDTKRELRLFKKLYSSDKRIKCDKMLRKILLTGDRSE